MLKTINLTSKPYKYKSRIKNENLIIRNKNRELTENRKKCEKIKQYINKSNIAQMEKEKKRK